MVRKIHVGDIFTTNNFGLIKVIKYESIRKVTVVFLNTGYITTVSNSQVFEGRVKDWSIPSLYGVGIMDIKNENRKNSMSKEYKLWSGMIRRCYDEVQLLKKPSYQGCEVSDTFKTFSNFKNWCNKQVGFNIKGFALDKDLLVKGNKVYSEDTCCFIPIEINSLLCNNKKVRGIYPIGVVKSKCAKKFQWKVKLGELGSLCGSEDTPEKAFLRYKSEKEKYMKYLANKWKDEIDPIAYEALMNWKIEITD